MQRQVSQITLLQSVENSIYEKSLNLLDDDLGFVDELAYLYSFIQNSYTAIANHLGSLTPEQVVALQSALTCRHQLVCGVSTLLKGHSADAFSYLRKSAEFTIFAGWVFNREGSAIKWLNAGSSEENWKSYKDAFKIHNMTHVNLERRLKEWDSLSRDLPKMSLVIDNTYDVASKKLHASILAAGPISTKEGLMFNDSYCDIESLDNPESLVESFYFILWRHLDILDVQARVVLKRASTDFNEAFWLSLFDPLEKRIVGRLQEWRKRSTS